ncbi:SMC-Scp complex subunit ScpB [Celeribacter persicus]|uniref:SMC-Scp complex subunit ScpB n=1 Tax=Celeribacter persicus TaxID=1651082 RepID=UPI00318381B2
MTPTRAQFADAIKAAANLGEQSLAFTEIEMGVLCAIAYHQPIDRAGLAVIFGKEVSRDLLARLRYKDLITSGPRSPRPGPPHTFVTTETFLVTFDLESLRDLPELELQRNEG